jgi:tetratricopeptide (TPR) repeat protein
MTMWNKKLEKFFTLAIVSIALASCGQPTAPPKQAASAVRPDHDLVASVRAAGEQAGSAVEVKPLRDPAVDGFLRHAEEFERQDKIKEANAEIERALKLAPDAPELLQYQAELMIAARRYDQAEQLARRSFDIGPKVGSLCARNWQTIVETRRVAGDAASVDSARQQVGACRAVAPVRM